MWEFLLTDCQIVFIPEIGDQILNTRLMVNELKIDVEVERGKNKQVSKESLSQAIKFVMDKDNETANMLRANRAKLKQFLAEIFKKNISTVSSKLARSYQKGDLIHEQVYPSIFKVIRIVSSMTSGNHLNVQTIYCLIKLCIPK
ncbi:hypothetical protein V6N13_129144 [Hibiscus sabdariffa]|uniref:Glucuronosyltransferase n=1 Tax=Hibiscus sabdariffa TaxID=183260 RepID=A0ABR2SK93_9ROSI